MPAESMLAFDNPWEVIGLIGAIVAVRVVVPRIELKKSMRATILEFVDSILVAALLVFCLLRPFVIQAFFIPSGSMSPTLLKGDRILVNKFIYFLRDPKPGEIVVFNAPPAASEMDKDFIKRVVGTPGDRLCVHDGALYRNGKRIEEEYIAGTPHYVWPPTPHDPMTPSTLHPNEDAAKAAALYYAQAPDGVAQITQHSADWVRVTAQVAASRDSPRLYRVELRWDDDWHTYDRQSLCCEVPEGSLVVMGDNRNDSNDSHKWGHWDPRTGKYVNQPYLPRENVLGKAMVIFWPPQRIRLLN
ncbi:MAG: signal peptidase I [Armatimonadota bacterium]|nr:signal peptidase I [Armatimonadota bacterium]